MVTVVSLRGDASYIRSYVSKGVKKRDRSLAGGSSGVVYVRVCAWCTGADEARVADVLRSGIGIATGIDVSQRGNLARSRDWADKRDDLKIMANERMRRVFQRPAV